MTPEDHGQATETRFIVRPVGASMFEVYDRQFSKVVEIPYHPRRTRQRVRGEIKAAEYAAQLNVGGWVQPRAGSPSAHQEARS